MSGDRMNHDLCESMGDRLVAYADGELSAADAQRVEAHLALCGGCRGELRRLRRSLELARAVWHEAAAGAPAAPVGIVRPRRRVAAAMGMAACAAVLLVAGTVWYFAIGRRPPGAPQVVHNGHVDKPEPAEPPEEVDVEALIAREGRAARLAAAVRLMAEQPGLDEYTKRAEQYLAETYGRGP